MSNTLSASAGPDEGRAAVTITAMPPHPFTTWPRRHRTAALIAVGVPSLIGLIGLSVIRPLGEETLGAFEFARTVPRAEEILATWRAEDVIGVAKALQLADLVFPFVFFFALAGACVGAAGAWARAGRERLAAAANALAWVATAAIAFDYLENLGIAVSLWGEPASPWPQIAFVGALLKTLAGLAGFVGALSWPVAAWLAK